MTNPLITIHDSTTDESITREMNATEFKQYEANQAAAEANQAEAEAAATAKAALLARLGITADEAKLLLG
jgi:hypothetical protein